VTGPDGERQISTEEFCIAPGKTVLQPGELLVSLKIPPPEPGFGAAYLRFIPRNEMDIAIVGAGAALVLDADGWMKDARIALGAVAPTPLFVKEAGEILNGKAPTLPNLEKAAQIAVQAAQPIRDMRGGIEQRKHLSGVLTRRALEIALERAKKARVAP
jgi:carbon-monoxide dehydrogenase medium subunit